MSTTCNSDCSSCDKGCKKLTPMEGSSVKKIIGVVSGKGGVGKSLVTSLLAAETARKGKKTAILDADITGPSIPRIFGIRDKAGVRDNSVIPVQSATGIKIMSLNLLLDNDTDPVVWRGPVISGTVSQFFTEVEWGEVDCMYVDMPPGTGDVTLTVFQSLPLNGIVIVTTPQDLVGMIVEKAVKMAGLMKVPILGIVENMSYFQCDGCGKKHYIYGESNVESIASAYNIENIVRLPVNPTFAAACDSGVVEILKDDWMEELTRNI